MIALGKQAGRVIDVDNHPLVPGDDQTFTCPHFPPVTCG
jgi:hypothetical protein